MSRKIAVVIGNGESRKEIDLNELVGQAKLYGCNALYRDFSKLDYLIAMDDGMIEEIQTRLPLRGTQAVFPPEEERYELSGSGKRNNAGMIAMEESIKHGHDFIYCIGFDFIEKASDGNNNVYNGTENYGPETRASRSDHFARLKYFDWYASQRPNVIFCFVMPDNLIENDRIRTFVSTNILAMKTSTFLRKVRE